MTIWSMSSSCGFLGGSCGRESAGPSYESVRIGSSVASSVVEKASVSFGSVQSYTLESQFHNGFHAEKTYTSTTPCGRTRINH